MPCCGRPLRGRKRRRRNKTKNDNDHKKSERIGRGGEESESENEVGHDNRVFALSESSRRHHHFHHPEVSVRVEAELDNIYELAKHRFTLTRFDSIERDWPRFMNLFVNSNSISSSLMNSYRTRNLLSTRVAEQMMKNTQKLYDDAVAEHDGHGLLLLRKLEASLGQWVMMGTLWSANLSVWHILPPQQSQKEEEEEKNGESKEKVEENSSSISLASGVSKEQLEFGQSLALVPFFVSANKQTADSLNITMPFPVGFFLLIRNPTFKWITDEYINI